MHLHLKPITTSIFIGSLLFFNSCSTTKTIELKDLNFEIPKYWSTEISHDREIDSTWLDTFNDEYLERFVQNYKKNNLDLKSLIYNKNIAYQSSIINGAGLLPSVNSSISVDTSLQNFSSFGLDASSLGDQFSNFTINPNSSTSRLGIGLQWEIDIWGRLLNAKKAAKKDFRATEYDLSFLALSSLIRSIQAYFKAVEAYGQFIIAKESYESFQEIRNLVKDRYKKGLKSSLDYRLAETSVSTSKVKLENKNLELGNMKRFLETLIGQYPSSKIEISKTLPSSLPLLEETLPGDLIIRRPDIKSHFLKLESAGYLLAQSKRNLLPGISVSGSAGTATKRIQDILKDENLVWNAGLALSLPIFNSGKLKAASKIEESRMKVIKNNLEKALLTAFSEVEQLLSFEQSLAIQLEAMKNAVNQSLDAYKLSKERYDKGITSLELVLNSQSQYNNIRSQYLTLIRLRLENRLSLLLALGGKWN